MKSDAWSRRMISDLELTTSHIPWDIVKFHVNELRDIFKPCEDLVCRIWRHETFKGIVIEMGLR
jgi:hypothetical protein